MQSGGQNFGQRRKGKHHSSGNTHSYSAGQLQDFRGTSDGLPYWLWSVQDAKDAKTGRLMITLASMA